MKIQGRDILFALCFPLVAAGCSNTMPTQAVATDQPMTPAANDDTIRYVNPNANLKSYRRFLIDPVTIYSGSDAQFDDVSEADKVGIAGLMIRDFQTALSKNYQVVTAPGPGVLRIHMTLAGIQTTQPGLSTVTHVFPVGLASNLVKSALPHNGTSFHEGSFMGNVTLGIDLYDSVSGELVGSILTLQHPNAMDLGAVVNGLGAARTGVAYAAEEFAAAIDHIQATGQMPPAD